MLKLCMCCGVYKMHKLDWPTSGFHLDFVCYALLLLSALVILARATKTKGMTTVIWGYFSKKGVLIWRLCSSTSDRVSAASRWLDEADVPLGRGAVGLFSLPETHKHTQPETEVWSACSCSRTWPSTISVNESLSAGSPVWLVKIIILSSLFILLIEGWRVSWWPAIKFEYLEIKERTECLKFSCSILKLLTTLHQLPGREKEREWA